MGANLVQAVMERVKRANNQASIITEAAKGIKEIKAAKAAKVAKAVKATKAAVIVD